MSENLVAKRYARALVQSIGSETEYDTIRSQLEAFGRLLAGDERFSAGMETQLLSKGQKRELLAALQAELGFAPKTIRFLEALLEENRVGVLAAIMDRLEADWFEKNGVEKLRVYSAVPLDGAQEKALSDKMASAFAKKIVIENRHDPSLIAGLKIQRGSVFYDFSIEGNLKRLRETIQETVIPETPDNLGEGDGD